MEQTTHEILTQLKGEDSPVKGKLFAGLQRTLDTSDLVKFAKYTPLADENHYVLVHAYTLVEETKLETVEAVRKQVSKPTEESKEAEVSSPNEIKIQS